MLAGLLNGVDSSFETGLGGCPGLFSEELLSGGGVN